MTKLTVVRFRINAIMDLQKLTDFGVYFPEFNSLIFTVFQEKIDMSAKNCQNNSEAGVLH